MSDIPVRCGVDIGASATKLVLLGPDDEVLSRVVRPSGVDYRETARACLEQGLAEAGLEPDHEVVTVSTGYGRHNVASAIRSVTEIHCHAIGCYHLVPEAITIVDIGGQDNKVIQVAANGQRLDFRMNRKCAAGTGAFIEEIAVRLAVPVEEMDGLARGTDEPVRMSSFCTVFAKTEILAHLRKGIPVQSIVRGAFDSVVLRVTEMAPLGGKVVLTGGVVAHNPTIAELLAERVAGEVVVAPHPQFTGALGAALLAGKE